jgi:hypothetical protein
LKVLVLGILALAAVAHLTQTPSSHLGLASGLITLAFIVGVVASIEVGLMTLALELGPRIAVSGIWDPFICSKELEFNNHSCKMDSINQNAYFMSV